MYLSLHGLQMIIDFWKRASVCNFWFLSVTSHLLSLKFFNWEWDLISLCKFFWIHPSTNRNLPLLDTTIHSEVNLFKQGEIVWSWAKFPFSCVNWLCGQSFSSPGATPPWQGCLICVKLHVVVEIPFHLDTIPCNLR